MSYHTHSGYAAENRACDYLTGQGLQLIERNFHSRRGELDLIMRDGEVWVFVEVRQRSSRRYGSAAETVSYRKQTRLLHAASYYLQSRRIEAPCRFDVIAIDGGDLTWIKDAFQAG